MQENSIALLLFSIASVGTCRPELRGDHVFPKWRIHRAACFGLHVLPRIAVDRLLPFVK